MKTVMSIVGARPQFIKAAVVSRALALASVQDIMVHTGQHYDSKMSALFFYELQIAEPRYNLGIGSGPHGMQTGRMLEAIETALQEVHPDLVLTYGDTNSTIAGALAAAKLHLPIAHVEAGLRSFNRQMPEEINRVLTDHAADLLFAPTAAAVQNLINEGIPSNRIIRTGDVMYDVALQFATNSNGTDILQRLDLRPAGYILATLHRSENTDDPCRLRAIVEALAQISGELRVIVPLHPRTRRQIANSQVPAAALEKLHVVEPLGYLDMATLEKHARLIATDSGGVQKEAYFHRVPCVTLRKETEWLESLEGGCNRLAPPSDTSTIVEAICASLNAKPSFIENLYGNGRSAEYIAEVVAKWHACPQVRRNAKRSLATPS